MPIPTHKPEADLFVPLEHSEEWDPHTVHTHYFGFTVPNAAIGAYTYIRYMPHHPLSHGGVCIHRGFGNEDYLDCEHFDYQVGMPWPAFDGPRITTANGLSYEFLEPGKRIRMRYTSDDGATSFDLEQEAVTPLFARGHVVPGEDETQDPSLASGGAEQLMHCTGELVLNGERFDVDCHHYRDRSWCQVRREDRDSGFPPVGLTPMYFGPDLSLSQLGFEPLDTDPAWKGVYEMPADHPAHYHGWLQSGGETLALTEVRRNVFERHPRLHVATSQEMEVTDETGRTRRFTGEAIAIANLPTWPNATLRDCVYRWQDEQGRTAHCMYQEFWTYRYQRAMRANAVESEE